MVSWFPLIMPELYNRLDPNNSESEWNFKKYQPDLVVIDLLQNDYYLLQMPNRKEYLYRFSNQPKPDKAFIINSYISFVMKIRDKYPNTYIICMLGSLNITKEGSPWPAYVNEAVQLMGDHKILSFFVPWKKTYGHPRVEEQKKMAEMLILFINKNIRW
jgi:hypothetical protein